MGSNTALRQFLKGLCDGSQWDYAVFWKLNYSPQMLLRWEDGYCGYPQPDEFIEVKSDNGFRNEISMEHPIRQAVASMLHVLYSFGEGVVGKVASTGRHHWIFSGDFSFMFHPEYANEWQLQFAVGIKTILLVPVLPYGVVQLGSLAMVIEDSELVAYVKNTFSILHHVPEPSMSLTSTTGILNPTTSSTMSISMQSLADSSYSTSHIVNKFQSDLLMKTNMVTSNDTSSQSMVEDSAYVFGNSSYLEMDAPSVAATMLSYPESQFSDASYFQMMGCQIPDVPYLGEDMRQNGCSLTELTSMDFWSFDDLIDQSFKEATNEENDYGSVCSSLNFPLDCELHKALGPALRKRCSESCSDACSSSNSTCCAKTSNSSPSDKVSNSCVKRSGTELRTVVTNVSSSVNLATVSERKLTASCQAQSQSGENSSRWSYIMSDSISPNKALPNSSLAPSPKSKFISEDQKKKAGNKQSKKGEKLSNTDRRKSKVDNAQKQRPRDRQMIQDRVKELRQLVPSGAKCSIDALLDQTIKHMLFLRSVTDQAEKLEQCKNLEDLGRKNIKHSKADDRQTGASWAVEIGSQFGLCPIVVKDLNPQGHLLIEMLCEKHELFLEIAQVIRISKLTILKGVMEERSDKMWAHFVVEVSNDFQRMDIFWPLMKLLQQNSPITSLL